MASVVDTNIIIEQLITDFQEWLADVKNGTQQQPRISQCNPWPGDQYVIDVLPMTNILQMVAEIQPMLAKESSITHPQSKFAKMDEKSNKNELATQMAFDLQPISQIVFVTSAKIRSGLLKKLKCNKLNLLKFGVY